MDTTAMMVKSISLIVLGKLKEAEVSLRTAAGNGNRDAMLMLAEFLSIDAGNPLETVEDYLRVIADLPDRTYVLYEFSPYGEAGEWLKAAAHAGSSRAMAAYALAQKDEAALELLKKAAAKGSWQAKVGLLERFGIQREPFMSDADYDTLLQKWLQSAVISEESTVKPGNAGNYEKRHPWGHIVAGNSDFREIYAKLRHGTRRQLGRLAYMIAKCNCMAMNEYAYPIDSSSIEPTMPEKDQHTYDMFRSVSYPYKTGIGDGNSFGSDMSGMCIFKNRMVPVNVDFQYHGNIYRKDGADIGFWDTRAVIIDLDCFEEENPLLGFASDAIDAEHCRTSGRPPVILCGGLRNVGPVKYMSTHRWDHRRTERTGWLMQAFPGKPADDFWISANQQGDNKRPLGEVCGSLGKGYAYFLFSAEKEFDIEVTHHKPNGEIVVLFSMQY